MINLKNNKYRLYFLIVSALFLVLLSLSFFLTSIFKKTNHVVQQSLKNFESGKELQDLNKIKLKQLTSYGWTDKKNGFVHIPVKATIDYYIKKQNIKK
jgi:hypothetical protein